MAARRVAARPTSMAHRPTNWKERYHGAKRKRHAHRARRHLRIGWLWPPRKWSVNDAQGARNSCRHQTTIILSTTNDLFLRGGPERDAAISVFLYTTDQINLPYFWSRQLSVMVQRVTICVCFTPVAWGLRSVHYFLESHQPQLSTSFEINFSKKQREKTPHKNYKLRRVLQEPG